MFRSLVFGCALCLALAAKTNAADCNPAVITIQSGKTPAYSVPDQAELAAQTEKYGEPVRQNQVLAIDASDGSGYWIDRSAIGDTVFLLDGDTSAYRYTGPDHCAPSDLPIDLTKNDAAPQDQKTDRPTQAGPQPLSGQWQLLQGQPQVETCPDMMRAAMLGPVGGPLEEFSAPRPLSLTQPFHPDQLEMTRKMGVTWKSVGPGHWRTQALETAFSQLPQNGGKGSNMTWDLHVLSPDRIRHHTRLTVVIPPEAAAAFGTDVCVVTTSSDWVRTGS